MSEQPINEVVVNTHGPTITVKSSTEPLSVVLDAAMRAYDHARQHDSGPSKETAGSVGFSGERRNTPPAQPSGMWWAPGQYPIQSEGEAT